MEGRLRFLKTSAQLSTLSVNLYEPPPLVASHPGRSVIGEAFKTAWRNFVGLTASVIASLGFVGPLRDPRLGCSAAGEEVQTENGVT